MFSFPCPWAKENRFAALPGIFDFLKFALSSGSYLAESPSICGVVSPLLALTENQVGKFREKALKCTYIGEQDNTVVEAAVLLVNTV